MTLASSLRSTTAAVVGQQRPRLVASTSTTSLHLNRGGVFHFHCTPLLLKKQKEDYVAPQKRRIEIPVHKPTPKPRRGAKIGIPYVRLMADPSKPDELGPIRPLEEILASVNEEEYAVELVSETPPVVKLVDLQKARLATLLERQRAKKGAGQRDLHKEIQLTWSMAESDEAHKLSKARQELEKGHRVDLVYSPKKGTKPPPRIEIGFKLKDILQKFEDIGKEVKPPTIDHRLGVLYLQPKAKISARLDVEQLKEIVPKSVLEHQKAVEKERRRAAAEEARKQAAPLESTYKDLWGA